jgi:glycosyltransferase involved in cell wall biosynthesis
MARVLLNGSEPYDLVKRRSLMEAIVARGHDLHVSSPPLPEDARRLLTATGAEVHEVDLSRTGRSIAADLRYARSLRRLNRKLRPDIVIGYTIKPNIWGTLAGAAAGARPVMVITGLGYAFLDTRDRIHGLVQTIARGLYRIATAKAEAIAFQNPDDRADFVAAGCLADASKTFLINGSGVDVDHFRPAALPDAPVFLMLTRLIRAKGIDEYADAASLLRAELPDAQFLLAGPLETGPDAFSDREVSSWSERGLEYLGSIEDVRPVIAGCSVFVLPSWREGTPRSVLEAMAMARPIVTTDAPGCRETTQDGVNGHLVPVGDPVRLAAAMRDLARDPAKRKRMGEAGRRIAEERYAVEKVNAALLGRIGL